MKRLLSLALLPVLLITPVVADSIDEAEAKQRGLSVEAVQLEHAKREIADLKAQVLDLKAKLAAATAPATVKAAPSSPSTNSTKPAIMTLEEVLGQVPANLRDKPLPAKPTDADRGNAQRTHDQRIQWIKSHSPGGIFTCTLAVKRVDSRGASVWLTGTSAREPGKPSSAGAALILDAYFEQQADPKMYPGDVVTFRGEFADDIPSIKLVKCQVVSIVPGK